MNEDEASIVIFLMCSFSGERETDSIQKIKHFQSLGKKVVVG